MKTTYIRGDDNKFVEESSYKRGKAIDAMKRVVKGVINLPQRTFEHYKGKIQEVNKQRRERDRQMQEELDARMRPKEKDSSYITIPPARRQDVMSIGRRIIK